MKDGNNTYSDTYICNDEQKEVLFGTLLETDKARI